MAKRLKLDEWADGRARPIAMLVQTVATSSQACHEAITRARKGLPEFQAQTAGWAADDWLRCYREPGAVEGVLMQFVYRPQDTEGIPAARAEWPSIKREMIKATLARGREVTAKGNWERGVKKAKRHCDLLYKAHLHELESEIQGRANPPRGFGRWLATPEFVFFLAIAAPCWLTHREWPWTIYRRAAGGDLSALKALMRLDPLLLQDSGLREIHFRLQTANPARASFLRQDGEQQTPTLDDTKFLLAGMLHRWSHDVDWFASGEALFELAQKRALPGTEGEVRRWVKVVRKRVEREHRKSREAWKLTPLAIRRLFDATATDCGIGLVDPDFGQSPEAFQKRVKRNADAWPSLR